MSYGTGNLTVRPYGMVVYQKMSLGSVTVPEELPEEISRMPSTLLAQLSIMTLNCSTKFNLVEIPVLKEKFLSLSGGCDLGKF